MEQDLGQTAGKFSKTKVINLTGKFINFKGLTIKPDGLYQITKHKLLSEKLQHGIDFEVFQATFNPLPSPVKGTILLLNEQEAILYGARKDVYYPVAAKVETYHTGSPMYYSGIARVVDAAGAAEYSHEDGY